MDVMDRKSRYTKGQPMCIAICTFVVMGIQVCIRDLPEWSDLHTCTYSDISLY